MSGHGTWQDNTVSAELKVDRFDLGLLAKLESLPVQGLVSGSAVLAGNVDTLDVKAELSVSELNAAGVAARTARADVAAAFGQELSGQIRVAAVQAGYNGFALDSVHLTWDERRFGLGVWRPGVQVGAEGFARLARDSINLDVAMLRVAVDTEALTFEDPLRLHLRPDSLDVRLAVLGLAGGDVRAEFSGATGKKPRIEAVVSRVDLVKLKALLGFGFDVSGTVSLNVSGSDTFDVALDAERLLLPFADVDLARVQGSLRAGATRAAIDHLWLVHLDSSAVPETSVVSGSIEYRTEGGFELGAADLRARLRNPGVWVVFYLKPTLELLQGTVYGDLSLNGSLMQPQFGGRVRISRARLASPLIGAVFDRVNAELVFDRNRINIEKLTGRSDHGNALVTGFVDIGREWQVDTLSFHGNFSGTAINPQPEIYGVIGGSLDVDWAMGRPFSISGTVDIEEALIAFGFGQSAGTGTGAPDTTLVFDVRVRGERNIWFRNQLADIEFAGDLTVRKTLTDMFFSGELRSRQGSVYYLDHTLRVDSGVVRFENIHTLNPEFNVVAELPVRAGTGSQDQPDKVILTVTGTLEKPSFVFGSDPSGWTEEDVISYLTLNLTPEQLSAPEQRGDVTKMLPERLLSYFQTQVSKRARGFVGADYLEFESGLLSSGEQARVTVGKYVGRNLYVSYTQNFTSLNPAFRVEYYINRKNEILAEGTPGDGTPYRTSLRYQFKLRY